MKRVKLRISGVVQGVAFRYHTVETALRLGLTGWVRNVPDGTVETLAEGEMAAVDEFMAWCHEGPRMARVDGVTVTEGEYGGDMKGFQVIGK